MSNPTGGTTGLPSSGAPSGGTGATQGTAPGVGVGGPTQGTAPGVGVGGPTQGTAPGVGVSATQGTAPGVGVGATPSVAASLPSGTGTTGSASTSGPPTTPGKTFKLPPQTGAKVAPATSKPDPYPEPIHGYKIVQDDGVVKLVCGGAPPLAGWKKASLYEERYPAQARFPGRDQTKSAHYREQGITMKLEATGTSMTIWSKLLYENMERQGHDAIAYALNPDDPTSMVNVVLNPDLFDKVTARKQMEVQQELYDAYDRANDREARAALLKSISTDLHKDILHDIVDRETFVTLYIKLLSKVVSFSPLHYESIKTRIKARRPKQYKHENISLMVRDSNEDFIQLENGCRMEVTLLEPYLERLQEASGNDRRYLMDLEEIHRPLKRQLKRAPFLKDHTKLVEELKATGNWYTDIGETAKSAYEDLHNNGQWRPASKMNDRSAVPSSFGANMAIEYCSPVGTPVANSLVQHKDGSGSAGKPTRDMSKVNCYGCGKLGHYSRDCTETLATRNGGSGKPNNGGRGRGGGRTGDRGRGSGRGGGRGGRGSSSGVKHWTKTPPKSGEPEQKVVDGTTHFYCGKCRRWNKTHKTAAHVKKTQPEANTAAAGLEMMEDPSCWMAIVNAPTLEAPRPRPVSCVLCHKLGHTQQHCAQSVACTVCHNPRHTKEHCPQIHGTSMNIHQAMQNTRRTRKRQDMHHRRWLRRLEQHSTPPVVPPVTLGEAPPEVDFDPGAARLVTPPLEDFAPVLAHARTDAPEFQEPGTRERRSLASSPVPDSLPPSGHRQALKLFTAALALIWLVLLSPMLFVEAQSLWFGHLREPTLSFLSWLFATWGGISQWLLPILTTMLPPWLLSAALGAFVGYGTYAWCHFPEPEPVHTDSPDFRDLLEPLQDSRGERRAKARAMKKQRVGSRSIHAFGLTKHYPRHLRSEGTYLTDPWSAEDRRMFPAWHECVRKQYKGKSDCAPNWRGRRQWQRKSKFRNPKLRQWNDNRQWKSKVQPRRQSQRTSHSSESQRTRHSSDSFGIREQVAPPRCRMSPWTRQGPTQGPSQSQPKNRETPIFARPPRSRPQNPMSSQHYLTDLIRSKNSKLKDSRGPQWNRHGKKDKPQRGAARRALRRESIQELQALREVEGFQVFMATLTTELPPEANLNTLMTSPSKLMNSLDPKHKFRLIWDSGASTSISNDPNDFVGGLGGINMNPRHLHCKGIAAGLKIQGEGMIEWCFVSTDGMVRTIQVPGLFIPSSPQRLLSTTGLCRTYGGEQVILNSQRALLTGIKGDPKRQPVIAVVDPGTDIPTTTSFTPVALKPALIELNNVLATVHKGNLNLSEAEKELLKWHYRLGHLDYRRIQFLMRSGILAHTAAQRSLHTAAAKLRPCPKCAACQYGKQCRRPTKGSKVSVIRDQVGATSKDVHLVGARVAVDHFICSTRGRKFTSKGKEAEKDKYVGGVVFVDLYSGFTHVEFVTSLTTHDTLIAKESFELMCRDHGVIVQEYLSDMGTSFTSKDFQKHLQEYEQVIRFAGAGGHHHNPQAERSIRTLTSIARTMMFHQAIHWPAVADAQNWPMAMRHALHLINHVPNATTGHSAHDVFSKTRWPHSRFHDLHVWGCPTYVLDKKLSDGQKIKRWMPRSERMIYIGYSPSHASSVPMILNPNTGAVKAVFNIVFDDYFHTVACKPEDLPDFHSDEWTAMFGESEFQYVVDSEDEDADLDEPPPLRNVAREARVREAAEQRTVRFAGDAPPSGQVAPPREPMPGSREPMPSSREPNPISSERWMRSSGSRVDCDEALDMPPLVPGVEAEDSDDEGPSGFDHPGDDDDDGSPDGPDFPAAPAWATGHCRPPTHPSNGSSSGTPGSPPPRGSSVARQQRGEGRGSMVLDVDYAPEHPQSQRVASPQSTNSDVSNFMAPPEAKTEYWKPKSERRERTANKPYVPGESETSKRAAYLAKCPGERLVVEDGLLVQQALWVLAPACFHAAMFPELGLQLPFCYSAKKSKTDPDTFTFSQCMASPERTEWMASMLKEIRVLEDHGTWVETDMDEPEQLGISIIPGTWTMKNKRSPAGEITKKKSRYCLRGDLEKGDFARSSPVVAWSTIRVFLVMCVWHGWETVTADFESAFVQSDAPRLMFMHLPRGFKSSKPGRRCLKLLKSLYGSATASRDFFLLLCKVFTKLGFTQSENDPCLWFKDGLIVIVYCDDLGVGFRERRLLDEFIEAVKKEGLVLTVESSFSEFLGIQVTRNDEEGTVTMSQPGLIKKVLEAANMSDCASNRSPALQDALGMDPDGEPMEEPWSYPSITGMLLYLSSNTRPDITMSVSQASRFNHSPKQSHAKAVKHILRYLKGTIELGITVKVGGDMKLEVFVDSDFAGLYHADPDHEPTSARSRMGYIVFLGGFPLFWKSKLVTCICLSTAEAEYTALSTCMRDFVPVRRVALEMSIIMGHIAGIPTTIWEDNDACRLLATNRHITSRTKYFLVKWHWFWAFMEENQEGPNSVGILRVKSADQKADYLTKSLPIDAHLHNRRGVQGA